MPKLLFRHRRHVDLSVAATALTFDIAAAYRPRDDDLLDGIMIIMCVDLDLSMTGYRTSK
jgi:hypothetical protein